MDSLAFVVGRAGRDAELRYTADGKPVCNMSVATEVGWGEHKKMVWYRVTTFGKLAETCGQYVTKGRLLSVQGQIQPVEVYQKRDGSWGASLDLIANSVRFLDKGNLDQGNSASGVAGEDSIPF